ncbi:MAG: hypothetical protein WKG01_40865 [Kofleriaceae bacterium]
MFVDDYTLAALLALSLVGLVVAVIRDRSAGAERRDARQRRAREREKVDRGLEREAERALPRATARPRTRS